MATVKPVDVLLVEDSPGDVTLVRLAFSQFEAPVNLRISTDGKDALRILGEDAYLPALVILDLNLPKLSGHEVLTAYQRSPRAPVVIFSSSSHRGDIERARALGAQDYIQKPTDLQPFIDAVLGIACRWIKPAA
ncbi:MAG: response regulator [Acidobacteriota bacterium]|nr:response regulator [Acidobacteriota bacterium]